MEWIKLIKTIDDYFSVVPNLILENGKLTIYADKIDEITLYPSTYQDILDEAEMYLECVEDVYAVYCECSDMPIFIKSTKEAYNTMEFLKEFIKIMNKFLEENSSLKDKEIPYI